MLGNYRNMGESVKAKGNIIFSINMGDVGLTVCTVYARVIFNDQR